MYRMTSSLRISSLSDTLLKAKTIGAQLGITRVTDTTWLDKIGIPVYASIRPDAARGSLCVNAGKGLRDEEAKVGAYMEAIEFAYAEYRRKNIDVFLSTPRAISKQLGPDTRFVDFCPIWGAKVDPDGPIACVEAEEITTGQRLPIPAELVFHPFLENTQQRIFGTTTNGLSSGNSIDEATVHGLCELIERDVQAKNFFRDSSQYVEIDVSSTAVNELISRVDLAGLGCVLRYTESECGLPYFQGFILEPNDDAPIAISQGSGLHPYREVAAVRALSEAAQSRLSYIHGGRDDLVERFNFFSNEQLNFEQATVRQVRARILDRSNLIPYSAVPDESHAINSIDSALSSVIYRLAESGVNKIFRVVLGQPQQDLAIVKLVVPKLESFQPTLKRVGNRLLRHVNA